MIFTSESVEVSTNVDQSVTCIDLYEDIALPDDGGEIHARVARLQLSEDQAVEIATLLLAGVTKLRAERLAGPTL